MRIDKNWSVLRLEGKITDYVDESQVCFYSKGKLALGNLPEIGFKFPLSPQCLVTCGDVSKGLHVIEKAA